MRREDDELLAAYLDGVGELAPDERRRIEQVLEADPAARDDADATRALLGQLRALPDEGGEPDWAMLERSIRAAVGPAAPRPWWRRWRVLVPVGALAATAAVAALVLHHPAREQPSAPLDPSALRSSPLRPPAPEVDAPETGGPVAVWLDGEATELGDGAGEGLLDDLDHDARDALATDEGADPGGILPVDDLGWIDTLDDHAADQAEAWLVHTASPARPSRKKG